MPDSILEEEPHWPKVVKPGPDNPLGTRAIYLSIPGYLLHGTNKPLYTSLNPIEETSFKIKTSLLQEIDAYARSIDKKVIQVSASISASYQAIQILRGDGKRTADIRPLIRLNVSLVVEKNGRRETGNSGCGGRGRYEEWINSDRWKGQVKEAL